MSKRRRPIGLKHIICNNNPQGIKQIRAIFIFVNAISVPLMSFIISVDFPGDDGNFSFLYFRTILATLVYRFKTISAFQYKL